MLAGTIGYLATIAVHWHVCDAGQKHVLPTNGSLAVFWIGGLPNIPYLCQNSVAGQP